MAFPPQLRQSYICLFSFIQIVTKSPWIAFAENASLRDAVGCEDVSHPTLRAGLLKAHLSEVPKFFPKYVELFYIIPLTNEII